MDTAGKSFEDLLESFLKKGSKKNPTTKEHTSTQQYLDPMTQLLSSLNPKHFHISSKKYLKTKATKGFVKEAFSAHPPFANPDHQHAYDFFRLLGCELPYQFNSMQLKKAYRKLLFRAHPDHRGTSTLFCKLKQSYEILQQLCC